jgi:hypothetical protein
MLRPQSTDGATLCAQKEVTLLENVTEAIKKTLGRLLHPSDTGPSPDEEIAAAWGRVDQKKDQVCALAPACMSLTCMNPCIA